MIVECDRDNTRFGLLPKLEDIASLQHMAAQIRGQVPEIDFATQKQDNYLLETTICD